MPSFEKGGDLRTPFGKNSYLRSTHSPRPMKVSRTFAASGIPAVEIDGTDQKVLQPGTFLAKIDSGPDADKVGVFDTTATDGREDPTNIVGINDTFLPWQLLHRDVEVAVTIGGFVYEDRCISYVAGVPTPGTPAAVKTQIEGDPSLTIAFNE